MDGLGPLPSHSVSSEENWSAVGGTSQFYYTLQQP